MNSIGRVSRLNLSNIIRFSSPLGTCQRFVATESATDDHFDEDAMRKKILGNALKFVPELGFSIDAINKSVTETGLSPASTKGIFKNGSFDLIDFFYKKSNSDLADYLEDLVKKGEVKSKNQLVRLAILHRLRLTQPYIKHWPEAMAVMTFNPEYALKSIENLLRLCDEVWYQLGDDSVDFNWYTKRLTLAALYKSTEFFMIQDTSEDFIETTKFLDNRLKDLGEFHKFKSQFGDIGQAATGTLTVLKNILKVRT